MTPKYGSVAEVTVSGDGDTIKVMYLAPRAWPYPSEPVKKFNHAETVILAGTVPYDGRVMGPGEIGPISVDGKETRWIKP